MTPDHTKKVVVHTLGLFLLPVSPTGGANEVPDEDRHPRLGADVGDVQARTDDEERVRGAVGNSRTTPMKWNATEWWEPSAADCRRRRTSSPRVSWKSFIAASEQM